MDALSEFALDKNIEVFTRHGVFTKTEIHSRHEIHLEGYCKTILIEALCMADIAKGEVIPASVEYQNELAKLLSIKRNLGELDSAMEGGLLGEISKLSACLMKRLAQLEKAIMESGENEAPLEKAVFCRDRIISAMNELRLIVDELETLIASKYRTLPTYADMLYSVF